MDATTDLQDEIARESNGLLYQNSFAGIIVTGLALSALVFGFENAAGDPAKLGVWIVMLAVLALRIADYTYWRLVLRGTTYDHRMPRMRFFAGCIATAGLWSAYSLLVFASSELMEFTTAMIIICAMAGGAASVLAACRSAATSYSVIILVPMSLFSLLLGGPTRYALGALGLAFAAVMVYGAFNSARFTRNAIRFKHENALLLTQVEDEKRQLECAHKSLQDANRRLDNVNATLEEKVRDRAEEVYRLSRVDALTGVCTRSAFMDHLGELAQNLDPIDGCFHLIHVNIDDFKTINDTLGHRTGDAVLEAAAKRLGCFAPLAHIGRWAGAEFLLTIPCDGKLVIQETAEAIAARLSKPMYPDRNKITVSTSISMAEYPRHSEDPRELIQLAGITSSKVQQKLLSSPALFEPEHYAEQKRRQVLKEGLADAVANDELSLVYQPIVGSNGQVWACEALLRWCFGGEQVSPAIFVPIAEQSGLIHEVGAWVLRKACADAAAWAGAAAPPVSVNVSMAQLLDRNFERVVDEALNSSGLSTHRLHLEITESVFSDDPKLVTARVSALHARGICISIDDFGTGYSSLSRMQHLRFDHVKIDKTFVDNFNNGGASIVRATINMARELNCQVVVEGVENGESARLLRALGVDAIQGYWYARPMLVDELTDWCARFNDREEEIVETAE